MSNLPDALKEFSVGAAIVGFIGAIVSVANQRELTYKEQFVTLLSGALLAGFVGFPIHEYLSFPQSWTGAICFLVGLLGRAIVVTIITTFKDFNLKDFLLFKARLPFNSTSSQTKNQDGGEG